MKIDPTTLTIGLVGLGVAGSVAAVAFSQSAQAAPGQPPIVVLPNGQVTQDGKPVRSLGEQLQGAAEGGAAVVDLGKTLWGALCPQGCKGLGKKGAA
jgi:hypothetical protein